MIDLLARTTAAVEAAGPQDRAPWVFARCWLRILRYEEGVDLADLDAALADYDRLPTDWPGRAKLAAVLVVAQLRANAFQDPDRLAAGIQLSEVAQADPAPLPDWPPAYAVMCASRLMRSGMDGAPGFSPRSALVELERHAAVVGDLQPHKQMIDLARLSLRHLVSQEDGSPSAATEVAADVRRISSEYGADSPLHARAQILDAVTRANAAALRGDLATAGELLREMMDAAERLPAGDYLRGQVDQMRSMVQPLLDMMRTDAGPWPATALRVDAQAPDPLAELRKRATAPGLPPSDRALQLSTLGTAELGTGAVDSAVGHLGEAFDLASAHDPRRPFYSMALGMALVQRYEMQRRPDDLTAGIAALERARELAGTSANAAWTLSSMPLAHAYRLAGRAAQGRQVGLAGLRGHVWTVLLQSDPADAQDAARHAAGDAVDVARWCLTDNDLDSAVAALDAGRGLILYASTETRSVETRLKDLEQHALAEEWRQALATGPVEHVPTELRRRVVSALVGVPLAPDGSLTVSPTAGMPALLDPPSLHEIRLALKTIGADALVYLVPGEQRDGAAVIVPVEDVPSWLPLPGLRLGAPADPAASPQELERLCDWAWEAAMGPLLDGGITSPVGRPPHLVLVPMGELARVPWPAARRRTGLTTEYAVERAIFSFAVSARLLCRSAWQGEVPLTGTGMVVADPDTLGAEEELLAARAEATAIRDAFYPTARYVGRRVDGSVSPEGAGSVPDLVGWLAEPDAGTMIHLACHAVLQAGADQSSYLVLAGNERLSAEALVLAVAERPGRDIALAVLAACRSGESSRGYDEAFSLGTALLASNVRSVISTQWSVSDARISVLMFMVHHFLREERLPPATALREAQLWFIRDRQPPDTMPASLRAFLRLLKPADLTAWAAFVHFGR